MNKLAEQTLSVPRPVVLKLLYACYIALYENFSAIAKDDKMFKTIKEVFNTSNASGESDGLVKRIVNFDTSKYVLSSDKLKSINAIMQ